MQVLGVRITGGTAKGRRLLTAKGMSIRPTSDKVREAIFNIIGQELSDLFVLDLFAGTGSLGIESLSRNAACAIFVDKSPSAINLIKKNLALCCYENISHVIKKDLRKGIGQTLFSLKDTFDLVFIDPPYRKKLIPPLLTEISSVLSLSDDARIIAESSRDEDLPPSVGCLNKTDVRIYGDTQICFYRKINKIKGTNRT